MSDAEAPPKRTAAQALAGLAPEPGVAKPDSILMMDGVRRSFGGLVAVDVDHLEVQRGAITALIGPNGAGKSTLFNVLTGFDEADAGRWALDGERLDGVPAYKVAQRGLVRSFQLTKALSRLTVVENMKLAAPNQRGERFLGSFLRPRWRSEEQAAEERADEILGRFKLHHMRDQLAGTLSGGQRKLLDMARALMTSPRLVCLDEPMAGVNPALTQSLLTHITALRDEGLTVVFVEHDMDVVSEISDWVVVMSEGRVIAEGPPHTVIRDERVIDAYLGTEHGAPL